jgi:PAS domain S-box-containing protein
VTTEPSTESSTLPGTQVANGKTETRLRLLIETGLLLTSERSLDVIVQGALDAGLKLSGATVGAFFYNRAGPDGEIRESFKVTGLQAGELANLPQIIRAESFDPSSDGVSIRRVEDLQAPGVEVGPHPFAWAASAAQPVRSYLAVPVRSRGGEVLGGLFYGHPQPGVFASETEDLVATVASQAAVAIDNAQLAENVAREIAIADTARQLQRATAERLAHVLESTSDGVALVDRNWRFTYVNRYANQLVAPGRPLVGVGFWDLFPQDVGSVFHQRYSEAMDQGRVVEFTERYEPLQMWAYVRVFPTPEGIAIFFQDVTRQKVGEEETQEAAVRLRQALDAGHLGTWTWDKASDKLDFDERAAQLFGVKPHQLLTRTEMRQKAVLPEDLSLTPEKLQDGVEEREAYSAEYRIALPGGGTRWIASTGLGTYRDGTREPTGMIGTVQDITARKDQEATLRQSEKLAATGRLAATIAHEINNPLEAVTNLIYLCKTDPTVPAPIRRLLETADGELARVAQIAQQTLGFYRDTARPSQVDLADLLASVVDVFSRKLLSKKLVCTLDVARDIRIIGLQGEIKQVFSNLLVNAIDASSSNTVIRIRGKNAAHDGVKGVSVLMADQGSGIPAGVRDRLFSPFFTTKQSVGTGLGLWVTRGIVEKQGGCIGFRTCTDTPSGTVFRVFLPAELADAEAFAAAQPGVLQ